MATLGTVYQTELIKSKNTFALWLACLGAGFMPALMFVVYLTKWETFVPQKGANVWNQFSFANLQGVSFFFIPFFVVLLCSLVINIEHKSNTWKYLLTLPVSRLSIYVNKLLIILTLTVVTYVLFIVFLLTAGVVLGILRPKLGFLDQTLALDGLLKLAFRSFVSTLAMLAIHYWLSIRLKNMIAAIGIGLICIVTATILFKRWEYAIYYPYTFTMYTIFSSEKSVKVLASHELYSLGYFVIITIAGYIDFSRFYKG